MGDKDDRTAESIEPIDIYENDLFLYLDQFCKENNIVDMKTQPQSVWNSALYYIYKNVFKGTKKLKSTQKYMYNNIIPSNYGSYNYELVNQILDIYIYDMCMKYDKEVSVVGFSTLTGIDRDTLYNWGSENNTGPLSSRNIGIFKKLIDMREESLTNKLVSMKHPTGPAIILNKKYGYNVPGVSREIGGHKILTASELPWLGAPKEQQQNPD